MPSKSNKRNLNAAPPTASASRRSNADDHHRPGGGDDLDENFLLDANVTLADSSDEESLQEDDDTSTALVEEAPAVTKPEPPRNGPTVPSTSDNATPDKKRKRPAEEDGKAKKRKTDGGGGNGLTPNKDRDTAGNPASQPPAIIAQYIVSAQKRTFRGISQMELEGMLIPEPAIVDTTSYNGSRDLGSLPEFFRQVTPRLHSRLTQNPKHYGAPTALVIAGAAMRVVDLVKSCRHLPGAKGGQVAKLFAKHIKLQEQIDLLHKTKVSLAIGTPDRIGKLLASEALQTTALTHIVLDVSHQDSKKRSLLDIPEVSREVFGPTLLGGGGGGPVGGDGGRTSLHELVRSGKVQLVLF